MLTNERISELTKLIPASTMLGTRPSFADLTPFLLEFLKEYEQSKWVKFKPNDKSTWPTEHLPLLVLNRARLTSIDLFNPPHWAANFHYDNITHWQPLPPLPER
jgi:hypothetical protein